MQILTNFVTSLSLASVSMRSNLANKLQTTSSRNTHRSWPKMRTFHFIAIYTRNYTENFTPKQAAVWKRCRRWNEMVPCFIEIFCWIPYLKHEISQLSYRRVIDGWQIMQRLSLCTCNWEVVDVNSGQILLCNKHGQVVHTFLCSSVSSIIWYGCKTTNKDRLMAGYGRGVVCHP